MLANPVQFIAASYSGEVAASLTYLTRFLEAWTLPVSCNSANIEDYESKYCPSESLVIILEIFGNQYSVIEGSLEVKLPTIWTDEKQRWAESEKRSEEKTDERVKNCTPLWREAHFQVKMYKTPQLRSVFRSCDAEKVHAVAARSTF